MAQVSARMAAALARQGPKAAQLSKQVNTSSRVFAVYTLTFSRNVLKLPWPAMLSLNIPTIYPI